MYLDTSFVSTACVLSPTLLISLTIFSKTSFRIPLSIEFASVENIVPILSRVFAEKLSTLLAYDDGTKDRAFLKAGASFLVLSILAAKRFAASGGTKILNLCFG